MAGLTREPEATTHVVAAVLRDVRGRVLLARRTEGRDLAGLWEFPGGKVDPGETPEAALVRELQEELGIDAIVGAPCINVPHVAPQNSNASGRHRRLQLDVRHITRFAGTPRGLEGQALAWVPMDKLASYAMPPADRPVVAALLQPDRYLVTPAPDTGVATSAGAAPDTSSVGDADIAWLDRLDQALDAGIERLQVRLPGIDAARRHKLLGNAVLRARAAGAQLLVNGDIGLAREFDIGLHLRAAQLREHRIRPMADGIPLAASCHDSEDLARAQQLGCDFVVLGPVHATATHPGQPGIGWGRFASMRQAATLPIYAIGGMTPDDLADARQHGAQGIAAIGGLWPS